MPTRKIILNRTLCIGSENCVRAAPNTFDVEDGVVRLKPGPHDEANAIQEAVDYCPVAALRLGESGNEEETQ